MTRFRLTLLTCLTLASPAAALEIVLRSEAVVGESLVRLGHVADIHGAKPHEARRLASLPLMPAPTLGASNRLSASVLRELLASHGVRVAPGNLRGARWTTVTNRPLAKENTSNTLRPAAATPGSIGGTDPRDSAGFVSARLVKTAGERPLGRVEVKAVEQRVTETIARVLEAAGGTPFSVRSVRLSEKDLRELSRLRNADLYCRIDGYGELKPGERRFLVWPESRNAQEAFGVVASLEEVKFRVIASEPINRGTLITASSLRLEPEKPGSRPRGGEPIRSIEAAVGKEATRLLRAGQVLTGQSVAPPMLVRKGETVTIVSGSGGISVRLSGVARADGRMGDLVTVEAHGGKERFDARVIGARRLAVLGAGATGDRLTRLTELGGLQ